MTFLRLVHAATLSFSSETATLLAGFPINVIAAAGAFARRVSRCVDCENARKTKQKTGHNQLHFSHV
jgi:hypothetical protein